jgi:ribosomal protein L37AE/L43A
MSADTPAPEDPYDIIPDDFEHDTLREAQRHVEPDYLHDKRCPADRCGSTNLTPLSAKAVSQTEAAWKCKKCGARFDTPRQSRYDEQVERFERERRVESDPLPDAHEQTTFGEVAR